MLRLYMRNTFFSPAALIAILGLYLSMMISVWPLDVCDLVYNYQYTISLGFTSFFIPVASVLPICYFHHIIVTRHVLQFCLLRSRKRSYTFSACISAMLSGIFVMVGAFILFTLTCVILTHNGAPHTGGLFPYKNTFYAPLLDYPLLLYILMGIIFSINGAMWPMISLLCFSITSNQYIAVSIPFIIRIGMAYLAQSLQLYILDPTQLLLKGIAIQWVGGGIPFLLLYSGIIIAFCGGIWIFREYRRIKYD